jgi:hypothetical protein
MIKTCVKKVFLKANFQAKKKKIFFFFSFQKVSPVGRIIQCQVNHSYLSEFFILLDLLKAFN